MRKTFGENLKSRVAPSAVAALGGAHARPSAPVVPRAFHAESRHRRGACSLRGNESVGSSPAPFLPRQQSASAPCREEPRRAKAEEREASERDGPEHWPAVSGRAAEAPSLSPLLRYPRPCERS